MPKRKAMSRAPPASWDAIWMHLLACANREVVAVSRRKPDIAGGYARNAQGIEWIA